MDEFGQAPVVPIQPQSRGFGTATLVCGIFALLIPIVGFLLAILAIIFFFVQKSRGGTGVATAGLVIGIIALIMNVIYVALFGFAYFGVLDPVAFNPEKFQPTKCQISSGFSCQNFDVSDNQIRADLVYIGGKTITFVDSNQMPSVTGSMSCTQITKATFQPTTVNDQQSFVVSFECNSKPVVGEYLIVSATILYNDGGNLGPKIAGLTLKMPIR